MSIVMVGLAMLGGCVPETDIVDLRNAPQAQQDAMLQVRILPLGTPVPPGVGSVGPVSGYGCGDTQMAANGDAVRQLQAKALRMQATAVTDVQIGAVSGIRCPALYGALAQGTAVGPRGIPPSY